MYSDVLKAYSFIFPSDNANLLEIVLSDIKKSKKTFNYVLEAVMSDRSPKVILEIAKRVGMLIPSTKLYSLNAYDFFISNVQFYEHCFSPIVKDFNRDIILTSDDPKLYLANFTDFQILDFVNLSTYKSRHDLIEQVLEIMKGEGYIMSSSKRSDDLKDKRSFRCGKNMLKMSELRKLKPQGKILLQKAKDRERNDEYYKITKDLL